MYSTMKPMLENWFLEQETLLEASRLVERYPWFAAGRYWQALKQVEENPAAQPWNNTSLYFSSPELLRLRQRADLLPGSDVVEITTFTEEVEEEDPKEREEREEREREQREIEEREREKREREKREIEQREEEKEEGKEMGDLQIPVEPYHTIDYFASLGIRLREEEQKDSLGKKVKSFTDWLKTMKKVHPEKIEQQVDEAVNARIQVLAEHSNQEAGVVTEAMADVLLAQGKRQQAMELYHKLSLINPDKNAYFARKIEELKNRI